MLTTDVMTVTRKEMLEISHMRESRRAFVFALLVPALILGVSFPIKLGTVWVDSPISLFTWLLTPFIIIAGVIADSVAGERERHTLETLLATRLATPAILLGKILASMAYALAVTVAFILLGILSVNLVHGDGTLLLPPFHYLAGGFLLSVFMASLAANLGVLISIRAKTVRQAQQTMGFAIMILFFMPSVFIPLLPRPALDAMEAFIEGTDPAPVIAAIAAMLVLIDVTLFLLALKRFRRSKLLFG